MQPYGATRGCGADGRPRRLTRCRHLPVRTGGRGVRDRSEPGERGPPDRVPAAVRRSRAAGRRPTPVRWPSPCGHEATQQVSADPATVRGWGDARGYKVRPRGRISEEVFEAFGAAQE